MKTLRNLFLMMMAVVLFTALNIAQTDDFTCGVDELDEEGELEAVTGGRFKPSSNGQGEYLRVLFVFAEFASDTQTISNWSKGQLPTWAYQIVDDVPSSNYSQYTVSEYFKTMSNGDFDVIGDIHPQVITVPTNMSWVNANIYVIDSLNNQIDDFTRYDNWYFEYGAFYFSESSGDGYLDMMHIIYRWADKEWFIPEGGDWGGIAKLGFTSDIIMHDGIKISGKGTHIHGSGITSNNKGRVTNAFRFTHHFAHEYGHYLFGSGHTSVGGIMPGDFNGATFAMSAWERERLGYISMQTAYNGQTKTLRDYLTSNDALKVVVSSGEWFIIENHQRLNYYDQIIMGGGLGGTLHPNNQLGKGIYVWYVKNAENYPPLTFALTADGSWEWLFDGWVWLWGQYLALLKRGSVYHYLPNQYLNEIGKGDRNPQLRVLVNGIWRHHNRWHDIDTFTKSWILSYDVMGDETDAFNIGYNEQITPWSNPSSTKLISGNPSPTNISIRLDSQNGNNITVKVYTTASGALNLPPSKVQKLEVSVNAQSLPVVTWKSNLEPDMVGGYYKIYRAFTSGGVPSNYTYIASVNVPGGKIPSTYSWIDYEVCGAGSGSGKIFYRVSAVDDTSLESLLSDYDWVPWDMSFCKSGSGESEAQVNDFYLGTNYPNPFNPATTISYSVKQDAFVTLKVYDILGSEVATLVSEMKAPGHYSVNFNASSVSGGLSSGVYIYRITATSNDRILFTDTKRMLLMK